MKQGFQTAGTILSLPWNAFVAAFLYYALLAVLALSGLSPSAAIVAIAYVAPCVAYLVNVAARIGRLAGEGLHLARPRHAGGL